jgi:hypothetical protein
VQVFGSESGTKQIALAMEVGQNIGQCAVGGNVIRFLKGVQAIWAVAIIGGVVWLGFCLAFSPAYARDEFYMAWRNLALALIPAASSTAASWLLGLGVCAIAFAPFIIIDEIKKKVSKTAG